MLGRFAHRTGRARVPERRSLLPAIWVSLLLLVSPWAMLAASSPALLPGGSGLPNGGAATAVLSAMANPGVPPPLSIALTLSPSSLEAGNLLTLSWVISPTTGSPWTLSWSGLPSSCQGSAPSTASSYSNSWTCSPSPSGGYDVQVQVTNGTGGTNSSSVEHLAVAAPLTPTLSVTPGSVTVGATVTFTYQVTGGFSPYTLQWSNLPSSCSGAAPASVSDSTSHSWSCMPSQASDYQISFQATDIATPTPDTAGTTSHSLTVNSVPPLQPTLSIDPPTITLGGSVTFDYQVTGGESPYTLQWNGLPGSCQGSAPPSDPDSSPHSWTCTPSQSVSTQVSFGVVDGAKPGNTATSPSQSLNVNSNGNNNNNNNNHNNNGNNSNGGNGSNNDSGLQSLVSNLGGLLFYLIIGVIVVFILIVITAVSSLASAILLARRLPPRGSASSKGPTVPCPSCGSPAPTTSKFCPECGKPMAPPKPS